MIAPPCSAPSSACAISSTVVGDEPADTYRLRYRRRGLQTFDADAAAKKEGNREEEIRALPG